MGQVIVPQKGGGEVDFAALVPLETQLFDSDTSYNYPTTDISFGKYINSGYREFYVVATSSSGSIKDNIYRTWHKAVWDGTKFTVELVADFQGSGNPKLTANGTSNVLTLFFRYQGSDGYAVFGLKT